MYFTTNVYSAWFTTSRLTLRAFNEALYVNFLLMHKHCSPDTKLNGPVWWQRSMVWNYECACKVQTISFWGDFTRTGILFTRGFRFLYFRTSGVKSSHKLIPGKEILRYFSPSCQRRRTNKYLRLLFPLLSENNTERFNFDYKVRTCPCLYLVGLNKI